MNYDEYSEMRQFIKKYSDYYKTAEQVLTKHDLTFDEALQKADAYRENFRSMLEKYGISDDMPEKIIINICKLTASHKNDDVLKLCCMSVIDGGLLLSRIDDDEEKIIQWSEHMEKLDNLISYMKSQSDHKKRLNNITKNIKNNTSNKTDLEEQANLYSMALQRGFLYNGKTNTFLCNIGELVSQVNAVPELQAVKPYIYSAVLSRKHKLMLERENYNPNIKEVFKYQKYKIEHDNGKNFNTYQSYLELYEQLKRHYSENPEVDIAFSDYCFANLSDLSKWYYLNCEPNEDIPRPFRSEISTYFGYVSVLNDSEPDSEFDDFVCNNPVLQIAFENTLDKYPDILETFANQRYNSENTDETVKDLYNKSGVEKMCGDTKNALKYSEFFLIASLEISLQNMLIDTLEEFT